MPYSAEDYFAGMCYSNCEGILAKLNLSILYSRWKHLDVLYIINLFKSKIIYSSIFHSVSIRTLIRIIRDYIYG
jgi:hypothetical protein